MKKKEHKVSINGTTLTKKERHLFFKERPWGVILFKRNLKTLEQIKNLTSKTLLIKNIYSQRHNLNMLVSGQLFGFGMLNFKGDFDLTKK